MKTFSVFILLIISAISFSQEENKFNFFKLDSDRVIIFLDDIGDITTEFRAKYYRVTKLSQNSFNYHELMEDYYMTGYKAYEYNIGQKDNLKKVTSYYNSGQTKYDGYYNDMKKDSCWTYFYDNGNIEKVVFYQNDIPYLKEFYKKNGKLVFNQGDGKYKGVIIGGFKQTSEYSIFGRIQNGKMQGKWCFNNEGCSGIEYFKDGEYIKSETFGLNDGFKKPRIITLTGFDLHENVDIYKFIAVPREEYKSKKDAMLVPQVPISFSSETFSFHSRDLNKYLKYKNSIHLDSLFSTEIKDNINSYLKKTSIDNFWALTQFTVNKNNSISNVNILSNNKDIETLLNEYLLSNLNFQAVQSDDLSTIDCDIYLCIYCENGNLYIPEYNFDNQRLNVADFLK